MTANTPLSLMIKITLENDHENRNNPYKTIANKYKYKNNNSSSYFECRFFKRLNEEVTK